MNEKIKIKRFSSNRQLYDITNSKVTNLKEIAHKVKNEHAEIDAFEDKPKNGINIPVLLALLLNELEFIDEIKAEELLYDIIDDCTEVKQ